MSGEGCRDDPDELWVEAKKLLAAAPIINPPQGAAHPGVSHAEAKAAVWMRQNQITYSVAVINNPKVRAGRNRPSR